MPSGSCSLDAWTVFERRDCGHHQPGIFRCFCLGATAGSALRIAPGGVQGAIWGARDGSLVSTVEGKHPLCPAVLSLWPRESNSKVDFGHSGSSPFLSRAASCRWVSGSLLDARSVRTFLSSEHAWSPGSCCSLASGRDQGLPASLLCPRGPAGQVQSHRCALCQPAGRSHCWGIFLIGPTASNA